MFLLYLHTCSAFKPKNTPATVQRVTTPKPMSTDWSKNEYPFAIMSRTEIDGKVKGIAYEMYLSITGIPSSGQNIPENTKMMVESSKVIKNAVWLKHMICYKNSQRCMTLFVLNMRPVSTTLTKSSHRQEQSLAEKVQSLQD